MGRRARHAREKNVKITPVVTVRCLSSTNTSITNESSSVKNCEDPTLKFQSKVVNNYLWQVVNRYLANSFPSHEELQTKTAEDIIARKKMIYQ